MIFTTQLSVVRSQETANGNLFNVIKGTSNMIFFTVLLEAAGLDFDLRDTSKKTTIFAPTDNTFLQFDEEQLTNIITDFQWRLHLMNLLGYHMVGKEISSTELMRGSTFENLVDETITVTSSATGGDMMVNNVAKIVQSFPATNGVLYAVDALLGPPWLFMTIEDVLEEQSSKFSTMLTLGTKVDLFSDMALSISQPYTLFAPTNTAFNMIGTDIVNNLDNTYLIDVLGYHVVPGILTSSDLMAMTEVETMSGEKLTVVTDPILRSVTVDGVRISETDLLAINGIVHVIDGVLSPDDSLNIDIDPDEMEECIIIEILRRNSWNEFQLTV